jgi:UPF0755 protein
MTIRSGGRPRDPRSPHARRFEPDAYATDYVPEGYEPSRRSGGNSGKRRNGGGRGGGLVGLIKFLIFTLLLAAVVLLVALTALRPLVNNAIIGWAADSPAALRLPFVADIVREDLGTALTQPVSTDSQQVEFVVQDGDTALSIAQRLGTQQLIRDPRAFVFIASERELTGALQQGTFVLRKNMTPDMLVTALLAPPAVPYVQLDLRTGLRLEQITAKLQTLPLDMDVRAFYELVNEPPASLIADYPWLKRILKDAPDGASLEGFLWPGTYRILPDTAPEELVRKMLDAFVANVTEAKLQVPADRGMSFFEVLTLASIVEREAQIDDEKPLIAGVYQNRLDPKKWPRQELESDPTVFYTHDSLQLQKIDFASWKDYLFWAPIKGGFTSDPLPPDLVGYNTYTSRGLPPGPISTPTLKSIDAALRPDTADGYLYFLAKGDGSGTSAFAKTFKQHQANIKKYQKPQS